MYSDEKWGFDFCEEEFMSGYAGAYVFEDTFEMWDTENVSSNTMASARWDHVTNGRLSDVCGLGNGAGTMMFSGANFREVETLDVDMRSGTGGGDVGMWRSSEDGRFLTHRVLPLLHTCLSYLAVLLGLASFHSQHNWIQGCLFGENP